MPVIANSKLKFTYLNGSIRTHVLRFVTMLLKLFWHINKNIVEHLAVDDTA
jgi:hypothetical protein